MGDVKLTPRETADLLDKLDGAIDQASGAREQLIQAMAEREQPPDAHRALSKSKRAIPPRRRGKLG
jgi:hypothetical protein